MVSRRSIRTKADKKSRKESRFNFYGRQNARERKAVMRILITKYGGRCALCKELVNFIIGDQRQATIDHIMPLSKGGKDVIVNQQLSCLKCNQEKADKVPAVLSSDPVP